jgi:hypothetical protein
MESTSSQITDDEVDKSIEQDEKMNEEKRIASLGYSGLRRKIDENRDLCETEYDKPENCKPWMGDLIEIKRSEMYDHWAVYVGDRNIIHITLCNEGDMTARVKRDLLENVCGESLCRINNLGKAAQKRNLKPRSVDTILKYAYKKLNERFHYDPINKNCEHFVTKCRFGSRFSEQALAAKRIRFIRRIVQYLAILTMGLNSMMNLCKKSEPVDDRNPSDYSYSSKD